MTNPFDPFQDWAQQPEPPKVDKVICAVCNHQWGGICVDGYCECPECGYLNSVRWRSSKDDWWNEGKDPEEP